MSVHYCQVTLDIPCVTGFRTTDDMFPMQSKAYMDCKPNFSESDFDQFSANLNEANRYDF